MPDLMSEQSKHNVDNSGLLGDLGSYSRDNVARNSLAQYMQNGFGSLVTFQTLTARKGKDGWPEHRQGYIDPDLFQQAYVESAYGTPHEAYLTGTAVPNGFSLEQYRRAYAQSLLNPAVALGLDGSKSQFVPEKNWPAWAKNAIGYYQPIDDQMFVSGSSPYASSTLAHEAAHRGLRAAAGGILPEQGHPAMTGFDRRAQVEFETRKKDILQDAPYRLNNGDDSPPTREEVDRLWQAAQDEIVRRRPRGGPR